MQTIQLSALSFYVILSERVGVTRMEPPYFLL